MIVKNVAKRSDGGSDFGRLAKYITEGMSDDVLSKLASELPGFGQLTHYVAKEVDGAGGEKCVAVSMNRLQSVSTAAAEFYSKAMRNPSVENPVLHLILSWPEQERPSHDEVFSAGRDVLEALNLRDHQWIMAIHNDTDNLHCHIEVSRIHPDTYKSQHLPWLHKSLHKVAREIEIKRGWSHDNGLFVVKEMPDGRKFVVPNNAYRETDGIRHEPFVARLNRMVAWSDETSLVDLCRDVVAPGVIKALDKSPTWDAVHAVLADHGFKISKSGSGRFRLDAMRDDGEIIRLPIGKALRGIKFSDVEAAIGPFSQSTLAFRPTPSNSADMGRAGASRVDGGASAGRPSKRDPVKREARRLERAADRTALVERYRSERDEVLAVRAEAWKQVNEVRARKSERLAALRAQSAAKRAAVRGSGAVTAQRKALYAAIAFDALVEQARISEAARKEVEKIQKARPALESWRQWVERNAVGGDQAAVSALRGLVYQEKREGNRAARTPGETDGVGNNVSSWDEEEDAIRASGRLRKHEADALIREAAELRWAVTNNGNVEYRRPSGETVFVDKGNKITFDRKIVTDRDLELTLLHAKEKWGGEIAIKGGDTIFTQRMVQAAERAGVAVRNSDLVKKPEPLTKRSSEQTAQKPRGRRSQ